MFTYVQLYQMPKIAKSDTTKTAIAIPAIAPGLKPVKTKFTVRHQPFLECKTCTFLHFFLARNVGDNFE